MIDYIVRFMDITPERLARATAILVASEASSSIVRDSDNCKEKDDLEEQEHNRSWKHEYRKRKRCPDTSRCTKNGEISSNISKRVEMNEWAVSLLFIDHVHPSQQLLELIHEIFVVDSTTNLDVSWWQADIVAVINSILSKLISQSSHELEIETLGVESITRRISVSTEESTIGNVDVHGTITADIQFMKAMVALYYHSLEAILYCQNVQSEKCLNAGTTKQELLCVGPTTASRASKSFVRQESFHRALVACCHISVGTAVRYTGKIRPSKAVYSIPVHLLFQNIVQCSPYEFIKVLEFFFLPSLTVRSEAYNRLGSPFIFTLPRRIIATLQGMERYVLDSLLWACNSPLLSVETMAEQLRQIPGTKNICCWPPSCLAPIAPEEVENTTNAGVTTYTAEAYVEQESNDNDITSTRTTITEPPSTICNPADEHPNCFNFRVVEYIIDTVSSMAYKRIIKICKVLGIIKNFEGDDPMIIVPQQMHEVFRHIVRHHVYLFYDRHVDHWMLCTIYGVTRSLKYPPELKFAQIISAYVTVRERQLGTATCQQIVRHVRHVNTQDPNCTAVPVCVNTQHEMGNIISLYNKVFVPTMKEYLLNSQALRLCCIKLSRMQREG